MLARIVVAAAFAGAAIAATPLTERTVRWEPARAVTRAYVAGTPREDWINAVLRTRDGDLVAAGYTDRDDAAPRHPWDAIVMRLAPDGRARWERRIAAPAMRAAWAVAEAPNGDLGVAGLARGDAGDLDGWLLILDAAGAVKTDRRFGGPRDDRVTGIALDPRGGYVLAGETASEGRGLRDAWIVDVDANGGERWRRTIGTERDERAFAIAPLRDGWAAIGTRTEGRIRGYVVAGSFGGTVAWSRELKDDGADVVPHFVRALDGATLLVSGYAGGRDAHAPFAAVVTAGGTLLRRARYPLAGDARGIESCGAEGAEWIAGSVAPLGGRRSMLLLRVAHEDLSGTVYRVSASGENAYATACTFAGTTLVVGGYTGSDEEHGDLALISVDPAHLIAESAARDAWPGAVFATVPGD
jgi:hypothetical protein